MLAIIIPFYKLSFFEQTLQSLANQTDKRFKVYIGNDNSIEDPIGVLEKFKGQFDYDYHKFETNFGKDSLTKQWKRCIELSSNEEWIMILGDDDVLGNNVVEEFYKNFNKFKESSNVIRFATVSQNYKKMEVSEVYSHPIWEKASHSYFRRFKGLTRSSLSEYVFKRSSYNRKSFYDFPLAWHSDDWAWLEFSEGKPIFTINESVIGIGFSQFSLSGMNSNQELKDLATIQFYKKLIKEKLGTFSRHQALELLMEYEILIKKKRKLTAGEWFLLSRKYSVNFKTVSFFKLVRRILISIKK
ncbi:glycosyltransferase [Flavobacterium ustbae]|uniref:glycosyltransferase n=1 Tax=Flavobacterium ustbae TaxID=2488790 RepID=UPI000F7824CB|nr:glycosyltransferase [Flavobacterium ustbae]